MRNKQSELVMTNVRPKDYKSHREGGSDNCGDCTTRAMTYCLSGKMTYREIESEQYRLAHIRHTRRNTTGTWDSVLVRRGFNWVQLNNLKSRANIASYLASVDTPMVTLSRSHACAIHKGKVIDTWDSRGGRVYGILAKNEDIDKIITILSLHGIEAIRVAIPRYTPSRRKRSHWLSWF